MLIGNYRYIKIIFCLFLLTFYVVIMLQIQVHLSPVSFYSLILSQTLNLKVPEKKGDFGCSSHIVCELMCWVSA